MRDLAYGSEALSRSREAGLRSLLDRVVVLTRKECVCGTMPIADVEKIVRHEPLDSCYEIGRELGR